MSVSWGCEGCGGDVAVGGDAEVDGLGAAGGGGVGLGEFLVGPGEADLESFCFAGPSFAFGFGDAGVEVGADFFEAGPLGGVDSEERAPDGVLTALTKLRSSTSGHAKAAVVTVGSHDRERHRLGPGPRVTGGPGRREARPDG
jgi:hypothetical protein